MIRNQTLAARNKLVKRDATSAWRSPESKLAEAKETAEEEGPMRGRSDPSDPKYKACRRKQSKLPFVERNPDDDLCLHCAGTGIKPGARQTGWIYESEEPDDHDDIEQAARRASTHHESTQRRHDHVIDGLRKHHANIMQGVYEEADYDLAQMWRHDK